MPPAPTGLLAATVRAEAPGAASAIIVGNLDPATLRRVRQDALTMRARHGKRVTIEARFVDTPAARALLATLDDLLAHDIQVVPAPIGIRSVAPPEPALNAAVAPHPTPAAASPTSPDRSPTSTDPSPPSPDSSATAPDPFGLDPTFRRSWLRPLRFFFDHYWRVQVTGLENVPDGRAAVIAANHSGAIPADAFMLAVALELRLPPRPLRVLYDRFVDDLPLIGPLYRRLGGVPASFANAQLLLERNELLGLFPEGIAGVEKRYVDRYRLRPFKTGAARMALRTGAAIVPVAIVGAEEAYPVVARLYRLGQIVGVPWIPITPTFPLCGVAGALPLPTKWRMHFCPPIEPSVASGDSEETRVADVTARLRAALESGVADLLAKRQGIFV